MKQNDELQMRDATLKAKWLITALNISKVSDLLGISRHTMYKRMVAEDWKASEVLALNHYHDNYKKRMDELRKEGDNGKG